MPVHWLGRVLCDSLLMSLLSSPPARSRLAMRNGECAMVRVMEGSIDRAH